MAEFLTLEDAAGRLGVEYKTVYRLVRSGEIPAGKIGRIYRIREEDLNAYFERQKQLIAEKAQRTGLTALEGHKCSGCGNDIVSELSMGGRCEICGHEICQACWSIGKTRKCSPGRGGCDGETPTTSAAGGPGGDARGASDIDRAGDIEQALQQVKQEGKPAVTPAEALLAEETFLRSFAQRLEEIHELPEPLSDMTIRLSDARVKHRIESDYRGKNEVPSNRTSRFQLLAGGWGKPKACLILAARFLSRPDKLKSAGYDAEPVTDDELTALLNGLAREAERGDCFHVVLLGSPTGWSDTAAGLVTGKGTSRPFRDRRVAAALAHLHTDRTVLDEDDTRLWPFWELLAPQKYSTRVSDCGQNILQTLAGRKSLTLAEARAACGGWEGWVDAAVEELKQSGGLLVQEHEDQGIVITKL